MPSDARAGRIFNYQCVFERRRLKPREFLRLLTKRQEKFGQASSLLQPAAVEIVVPAERDASPFSLRRTDIVLGIAIGQGALQPAGIPVGLIMRQLIL